MLRRRGSEHPGGGRARTSTEDSPRWRRGSRTERLKQQAVVTMHLWQKMGLGGSPDFQTWRAWQAQGLLSCSIAHPAQGVAGRRLQGPEHHRAQSRCFELLPLPSPPCEVHNFHRPGALGFPTGFTAGCWQPLLKLRDPAAHGRPAARALLRGSRWRSQARLSLPPALLVLPGRCLGESLPQEKGKEETPPLVPSCGPIPSVSQRA